MIFSNINGIYKEYDNIEDFGDPLPFGFIYITTHENSGVKYLGKKVLFYNVKRKLSQKNIKEQTGRGRKKTHEIKIVESDWKKYYGSSSIIKELLEKHPKEEFTREIIDFGINKTHLTYLECKYLFKYGVLENNEWLNDNILGKFYSKNLNESFNP